MASPTHQDWLDFKKENNLTNKDIANIIGTSEQNVKMMANAKKPMCSWQKAFLFKTNRSNASGIINQ